MMEATFYEKQDKKVRCLACAHKCLIDNEKKGICKIRLNKDGKLYLQTYGSAVSIGIDPVEKKPLYHFLPGSKTLSFGTLGCNFRCGFCQNHEISMPSFYEFKKNLMPEDAVSKAIENDCKSISYTYTEPAVFAEYALDTAVLAKKKGLKNVLVTNGYFSDESLNAFSKVIDAVNIDLKSFRNDFYLKECGAQISPVLKAIKFFHEKKILVEVTTLIIPEKNDSKKELKEIANFIASINKSIPWHISRFFPMYKYQNMNPTPPEKLEEALRIGKDAGLKYVYFGNFQGEKNTYCPKCEELLIKRTPPLVKVMKKICGCKKRFEGVLE